jgi:hypothetical protein
MNSRSLYHFLLRLHPAHFRNKFEDQMLWIFDESVASRGAVSLMFDALVSLLRQWVLRSDDWWHAQSLIAVDGETTLEQLRRNAQTLHRKAWRLNLNWMVTALAVFLGIPLSSHWNPLLLLAFLMTCFNYSKYRQGRLHLESRTPSVYSWPDARTMCRKKLEGKRDGLRSWSGGVLALLVVLDVLLLDTLYFRSDLNIDRGRLWDSSIAVVILSVYWLFMKRCNERAAKAIQHEIDAIDVLDEPSTPQSV